MLLSFDQDRKWRAEILRRELSRQAASIAALATGLQQLDDYATSTPPILCELIRATSSLVSDHMSAAPDSQLQHISRLLELLGEHLRYVDRSRVAQTPWSLLESVEAFMRRHAGDECVFIIRPQWAYNYANETGFVGHYENQLNAFSWIPQAAIDAALGSLRRYRIYWISFPRVERLHAVLHAAWAHELGHTFAAAWLDSYFDPFFERVMETIVAETKARLTAPQEAQQDLFPEFDLDRAIASAERKAMGLARQGLTELISDAFAVHVMGAAWFAAAAEIAARQDLDVAPPAGGGYPPWRLRLRLMANEIRPVVDALESYGVPSLLPFAAWLRRTMEVTVSTEDSSAYREPLVRVVYDAILEHWSVIRRYALEKARVYDVRARLPVVVDLVARLEAHIPPNESGVWPDTTPSSLEDIINAGWIRKYQIVARSPTVEQDLNVLDRMILKGVESSELQQTFGPRLA